MYVITSSKIGKVIRDKIRANTPTFGYKKLLNVCLNETENIFKNLNNKSLNSALDFQAQNIC